LAGALVASPLTVGLVVPETVDAVPPEAAAMYPRLAFAARGIGLRSLSVTGYEEAVPRIVPAVRTLAARGANAIMVIGTSLTFFRGAAFERALTGEIAAVTGLPTGTMSGALVDGLREVAANRVAVVTAYSDEVNALLATFLEQNGLSVLSMRTIKVAERVGEASRITENDVFDAGVAACEQTARADGLLVVCGGLRTLDVTPRIKARCGIPVVSSMPAAIRKAAQLAGHLGD
jgi:arylmalonate decarboxylase